MSENYRSQLFQRFLGSTVMSGSLAQPAPPRVTATRDQLVLFYDPAPTGNLESNDVVIFQIGAPIRWPGSSDPLRRAELTFRLLRSKTIQVTAEKKRSSWTR